MMRIPQKGKTFLNGREEGPATLLEKVSFLRVPGACLALTRRGFIGQQVKNQQGRRSWLSHGLFAGSATSVLRMWASLAARTLHLERCAGNSRREGLRFLTVSPSRRKAIVMYCE